LVSVLLGGVMGLAVVLVLEARDRRIRDDAELLPLLGVPLLGRIPNIKPDPRPSRAAAPVLGRVEPSAI
jgi:capsular polysaccharide biosynthesis protein